MYIDLTCPWLDGLLPQNDENQGEPIAVAAQKIAMSGNGPYTPIDPRRYLDGDYPRVEGCIRLGHECLAQPSTITPNGRSRCIGFEKLCQAESFWRRSRANDNPNMQNMALCHNYSCVRIGPNGNVVFYDKRFTN